MAGPFLFWREMSARGLHEMLRGEDERDWPHLPEPTRTRYRNAVEELARQMIDASPAVSLSEDNR